MAVFDLACSSIGFGWIGATMALASVVKNPNSSCSRSTGALFGPRSPCQRAHNPAKANNGRSSLSANHVGGLRGFVSSYSQKDVAGTRQRFLAASQPRQWGLETLRMLATGWPPNGGGSRHAPAGYDEFARGQGIAAVSLRTPTIAADFRPVTNMLARLHERLLNAGIKSAFGVPGQPQGDLKQASRNERPDPDGHCGWLRFMHDCPAASRA